MFWSSLQLKWSLKPAAVNNNMHCLLHVCNMCNNSFSSNSYRSGFSTLAAFVVISQGDGTEQEEQCTADCTRLIKNGTYTLQNEVLSHLF